LALFLLRYTKRFGWKMRKNGEWRIIVKCRKMYYANSHGITKGKWWCLMIPRMTMWDLNFFGEGIEGICVWRSIRVPEKISHQNPKPNLVQFQWMFGVKGGEGLDQYIEGKHKKGTNRLQASLISQLYLCQNEANQGGGWPEANKEVKKGRGRRGRHKHKKNGQKKGKGKTGPVSRNSHRREERKGRFRRKNVSGLLHFEGK
jgi:hypothetical protein